MRRELVALGHPAFEPSEEQRRLCRVLALNDTPHERIAHILEITLPQLQYFFARELDLSKDAILAIAAQNMLDLSNQRNDLGVALRANELVLKTRSRSWRVPSDEAQEGKPVERMSLTEVDEAIARLERQRRDAAASADAEEAAPHEQGFAH
jgi:hypothetical protein